MTLYGTSHKISSYFVQAKLNRINRTVRCYQCGSKRSGVCKYIKEIDTFTSNVTGETSGVSVKFLMVGETNSMVGYYLMAKSHSIQLGFWRGRECCEPGFPHSSAGPG